MLPLHSIPTEIIRKGFLPYRGFLTKIPFDLPPEEEPLRSLIGERDLLTGAKDADLALSATPIYQVFADLFGYDPALLQAGNGDCGVAGHDWNLYGRKDRVPLVIRWRGFDGGEALLCLGPTCRNHLVMVAGLANESMAPKLAQAFAAFGEPRVKAKEETHDQPTGDLLQQVIAESGTIYRDLTAGYWCATHQGEADEQQKAELQKLRFSCCFYEDFRGGMQKYRVRRHRLLEMKEQQQPGQRIVIPQGESRVPLLFKHDEPIPEAIVKQIYANSVEDVERAMQTLMAPAFESKDERIQEYLHQEGLAITTGNETENERAYALAFYLQMAERGLLQRYHSAINQTSFSLEFSSTPPKSLVGTQPGLRLSGGQVTSSRDLVLEVITSTIDHADNKIANTADEFKLSGRVIMGDDLAQRQDQNPMLVKPMLLEKPYTALYRGLPVRVTECMQVHRTEDTEGLCADFFVDFQNQALHFVSLYRVPLTRRT